MTYDRRKKRIVPILKGKGDVRECINYMCMKLMSNTMQLWERMIEAMLREQEQEHFFDPKNVYVVYTVDTINIIKIMADISCKPTFRRYMKQQ